MIKLTSSRTGQNLGSISLRKGEVALEPAAMRRLMIMLSESSVGHLVEFTFGGSSVAAPCLFGVRAIHEMELLDSCDRGDGEPSDFGTLC